MKKATYAQVGGNPSWELDEVREDGRRCDGTSSIRFGVPGVPLLPFVPDLVDELHDRLVR